MADSLLTPSMIAAETAIAVHNFLVFGNSVHRDYVKEFKKVGDTVTVRKPVRFTVTDGATISKQDVSEQSVDITVDKRKHVAWDFSTQDLTLTIEKYSERYIQPGAEALANQIDVDVASLYSDVAQYAGTVGTTPASFAALGACGQRLDESAAPGTERYLALNPAGYWSMADALKGVYNEPINKQILRDAMLGRFAGFDIFRSQNIRQHSAGTMAGTPLVNGASQTGSSLVTDGWTAATDIKTGDVFTIAGVNAVNPITGDDTGELQHFVVTADATADGTGAATLSISPSITTSGAYQTVTASPADNAAITVVGAGSTYPANLSYHKNAFALVTVPLEMPAGVWGARATYENISVRVVKQYDIDSDAEVCRLDVMYGVKTIYPELAVRLHG